MVAAFATNQIWVFKFIRRCQFKITFGSTFDVVLRTFGSSTTRSMSISDQLEEAFKTICTLTTMTREEFACEFLKGGMERVDQLVAEAQVLPWEET